MGLLRAERYRQFRPTYHSSIIACNGRLCERPLVIAMVERPGQVGRSHQVFIDIIGRVPALGDGPDDQALAPGHVAGREHLGHARLLASVGLDVAHPIELDAKLFEHAVAFGPGEPHRQQNQIGGVNLLGTRYLDKLRPAVLDFRLDATVSSAFTRPFLPWNLLVMIEYSRTPPSSWADDTRNTLDHWGQGLPSARLSGGRVTISNWCTLLHS